MNLQSTNIFAITDLFDIAFLISDLHGKIIFTNSYFQEMFDYSFNETIGESIDIIIPAPHRRQHQQYMENYRTSNHGKFTPKILGKTRLLSALKKNGEEIDITLNVNELSLLDNSYYFACIENGHGFHDSKNQIALSCYLAIIELETIIMQELTGRYDYIHMLSVLNSLIIKLTKSEYGFIGMILKDESTNKPYLKTYNLTNIAWDDTTRKFYQDNISKGLEFRNLNSLFGYTIKTGISLISNDPANDPNACGIPSGHPPLDKYMGVALYHEGLFVGMYGIANRPDGYALSHISALSAINRLASKILSKILDNKGELATMDLDPITSLATRESFLKYISSIINNNFQSTYLYVLSINIKNFKNFNLNYGLTFGDDLLIQFSKSLERLYSKKCLFHIGADNFIALIPSEQALSIDNLEINSIPPILVQGKYLTLNLKLCLQEIKNRSQVSGYELLTAHQIGQNFLSSKKLKSIDISDGYQPYVDTSSLNNPVIIERCFNEDLFSIRLQPVYNNNSKIAGFEVLLRLNFVGKELSPNLFIDYIYNYGFTERVNILVVNKVMQLLSSSQWYQAIDSKNFKIAINISPQVHNFKQHLLAILELIKSYKLDLQNNFIQFEFTEEEFTDTDNIDLNLKDVMSIISSNGYEFAIDDFGTKYSSLKRLIDYKFNTLKIDMSFVQQLDKHSSDSKVSQSLVKSIIFFAHEVDMDVVAEGVETLEQLEILKSLNCDVYQGYYFNKPLMPNELLKLIQSEDLQ